jgi:hypothetical protein
VARAVIELSEDIMPVLPYLCRLIKGCACNLDEHLAAFRLRGMPIVIKGKEIIIYQAADESEAVEVMIWLKMMLSNPDETQKA